MNRTPVNSKNLASVGYEQASMILEVEFLDGRVYQYFDVPEFEYRSLMQAGSHGTYFNASIRSTYRYTRL